MLISIKNVDGKGDLKRTRDKVLQMCVSVNDFFFRFITMLIKVNNKNRLLLAEFGIFWLQNTTMMVSTESLGHPFVVYN